MKKDLKISVGIVTFNAEVTLADTIQSILNQTYASVEIIIIDGKSKDNTVDVIRRYEDRIAYWQSEKDKGIFDAMNIACKHATGDFLLFLGADDYFYNEQVLEKVIQKINDRDSIYYGQVYLSREERLYAGEFNTLKHSMMGFPHQALFYPRSVYQQYTYNLKYKYTADYDLNLRLWGKGVPFVYLDETITYFSQEGEGSVNVDTAFFNDKVGIIHRNLGIKYAILSIAHRIKIKVLGRKFSFRIFNKSK